MTNQIKTVALLAGLAGLLVLTGQLVAGAVGAMIGALAGLAVVAFSWWGSDRLAVRAAGARPVAPGEHPELVHDLHALAARAGIVTPRLFISPSPQPNAFAAGRNERTALVTVTDGLLRTLPHDQVRGVLAHEVAHIKNRDILIGSIAAAIATGISLLANLAMVLTMFGGGEDDEELGPIGLLFLAIVAPIAATVTQLAISRNREFEADRVGAELAGDPRPLADALATLEVQARRVPHDVEPAQASAYIVNPLTGREVRFANLFRTHPSTEARVRRLLGEDLAASGLPSASGGSRYSSVL